MLHVAPTRRHEAVRAEPGWSFLVAGWLCATAGAIAWWLRNPPRWLGVVALVPAAWAALVIWAEVDPAVLATDAYEFLPGRLLLHAGAILAVVAALVIVASPRRHRAGTAAPLLGHDTS